MPPRVGSSWVPVAPEEVHSLVPIENQELASRLDEQQHFTAHELDALNATKLTPNSVITTPTGRRLRPIPLQNKSVANWDTILRRMQVSADPDSDDDSVHEGVTLQDLQKNAKNNLERAASLIPFSSLPDGLKQAHQKATERFGVAGTLPFGMQE
tara:strand:+ start:2462 stop:2926 length:465 start_codon:yes stop_codon:yes gene_type:complete